MNDKDFFRNIVILLFFFSSITLFGTLISEVEGKDNGVLKFKFQVMSDPEVLDGDPQENNNTHFTNALTKIEEIAPDSRAIFIAGDILSRGIAANWIKFNSIVAKHSHIPKVYLTLGNHDLTDNGTYSLLYANYMKYSGMPGTYYDQWIDGIHFIILGQEDSGHFKPFYSETQLQWLEKKLSEEASYDKPIFLFSHYSIRNTSAGTYLGSQIGHAVGGTDKLRFMELLKKYPQIIYFTGHTHFALDDPLVHYNIDLKSGKGADIFCDGSISYLCAGTYEGIKGSQFLFVEVYERGVIIKGWDVLNNKWIKTAQFSIDTVSKTPTFMAIPSIEWSSESTGEGNNKNATVYITYEDTRQIEAKDGAWVGLVSDEKEGINGNVYRWVMLKDLPKDNQGRFVWDITDDTICTQGSTSWNNIIKIRQPMRVGLFEDTLYHGQQPTVPQYKSRRYDFYAQLAKVKFQNGLPPK